MTNIDDLVVAELDALAAEDKLTAEAVVELAADPGNPLHDAVGWWDDTAAAHDRRLQSARVVIARYKITILVDETPTKVRKHTYVPSVERYKPTEVAVHEWRSELEAQAASGLRSWRNRWRHLGSETLRGLVDKLIE